SAFMNQSAFPVLPALQKEGWFLLFASWNEKLEKPVKELGIPYLHLKTHYRSVYRKAFHKHQRQTKDTIRDMDCFLPARLLGVLSGFPLKWDAHALLMENIVHVRTYVDIYLDLLERYQPDIEIFFNEKTLTD